MQTTLKAHTHTNPFCDKPMAMFLFSKKSSTAVKHPSPSPADLPMKVPVVEGIRVATTLLQPLPPQQLEVKVPNCTNAGQSFSCLAPDGQMLTLKCPRPYPPGGRFTFLWLPGAQPLEVQVPERTNAGQSFSCVAPDGHTLTLKCPKPFPRKGRFVVNWVPGSNVVMPIVEPPQPKEDWQRYAAGAAFVCLNL